MQLEIHKTAFSHEGLDEGKPDTEERERSSKNPVQ